MEHESLLREQFLSLYAHILYKQMFWYQKKHMLVLL